MGESPGGHGILLGAPPALAGSCNISQAYAKWAEGGFPGFGPLGESGSVKGLDVAGQLIDEGLQSFPGEEHQPICAALAGHRHLLPNLGGVFE